MKPCRNIPYVCRIRDAPSTLQTVIRVRSPAETKDFSSSLPVVQACTTCGPHRDFLWPRGDWLNHARAPSKLIKYKKVRLVKISADEISLFSSFLFN
jgi:hypothetical protein